MVVHVMFLAVFAASGRPTGMNGPPPRLHQRGYIVIEVLLGVSGTPDGRLAPELGAIALDPH